MNPPQSTSLTASYHHLTSRLQCAIRHNERTQYRLAQSALVKTDPPLYKICKRTAKETFHIILLPSQATAISRRSRIRLYSRRTSKARPCWKTPWPRSNHPRYASRLTNWTEYGLIESAIIPITAFILGTWQVQRLGWKSELIAKFEDRLIRDPLPLPPTIDPDAIHDFDYRRVVAKGHFRHDQEMLIGPRMRDGTDGYMVVTPLERENGTTILVNRGWIDKKHRDKRTRPDGLPTGEVTVEGLLREPWKKNMFTPENQPEKGMFYFPDVKQMAALTGSQPVWVEATMGMSIIMIFHFVMSC